ncbi:MAG TPA: PA0069 family radical SAM protein [Thermohalobaculum sp.]|nr:PA0069 family radical SAM protein [Thermohalobaculum sp.]
MDGRREVVRGRGARGNAAGRYERLAREAEDDGWDLEETPPPRRTEVQVDASRSILARNTSPDVPFDRSINPYRGCEHGCIYCFARPTHAQLGLSPGLDFETRLTVKPKAPELLAEALRRPGYRVRPIAIGTNTDPYQPIERQHRIMRGVLEVLLEHRHPVTVTTKGALVTRDVDILAGMAELGLARVGISLTTLDHRLGRRMEPRAASPARRLAAMRELASAGVPVSVMVAPVVPALTDHELEALLEAAAKAGATSASWIMLRLPLEVGDLFRAWLEEHCPDRARRVIGRVRETHGGRDYDPGWGKRMRGEGAHAELIARRFATTVRRLGLDRPRPPLVTDLFRVPARGGDQLSLDL